jgi:hypothetical protein
MSANVRNAELAGVLAELGAVAADARRVFGNLTAAQLNWKPSEAEWSVGQCFEHLIKTNERFLPALARVAKGERKSSTWERVSPLSGFFGRLMIKSLRPDSGRRFKAPAKLVPSASDVDEKIIARFVAHQGRLAEAVHAAGHVDLKRIVVTSPVARFVTYSLLDACRIVAVHERRHIAQAERVMSREGFPATAAGV